MCGICGLYGSLPESSELLTRRMMDSISHRGPDDEGLVRDEHCVLGFRRLSIIDLEHGAQPMSTEDSLVQLVANGEIYNYRELRRELERDGVVFRTNSDMEVFLKAYHHWGTACFQRLNGMFAAAIYDRRSGELLLVRDRFGIKPLYWLRHGSTIAFASELHALRTLPFFNPRVDLVSVEQFLAARYIAAPRTPWQGVKKLRTGSFLRFREEQVEEVFYEETIPFPDRDMSLQQAEDRYEELLQASVKRQMISDVPLGLMLSGGVDSGLLLAMMTHHAGGHGVQTFTVGFGDHFRYNEFEAAKRTASRFHSDHHEVVVDPGDFNELIGELIGVLEEPIATSSAVAGWLLFREARKHVKVMLTGQGADEPLAGYRRYLGAYYGWIYRSMPAPLQSLARRLVYAAPLPRWWRRAVDALHYEDLAERRFAIWAYFRYAERGRLMGKLYHPQDRFAGMKEAFAPYMGRIGNLDELASMQYLDTRVWLADDLLMVGDKTSMAASLESRVPYLDNELVAFLETVPSRYKIRGKSQKYLHKKVASRWLPKEWVFQKKLGFRTPIAEWFQQGLSSSIAQDLNNPEGLSSLGFRIDPIREMLEEHASGRFDYSDKLFLLLTLEIWLRSHL